MTSIPSLQIEGPFWPMYSEDRLSDGVEFPASFIGASPSDVAGAGRYPYDVDMIAFGVSSPA
jgi:hypothetical protein